MSALEDRLSLLETQIREIADCIEQIARDADLLGTNIMRALKGTATPQKTAAERNWTWDPTRIQWQRAEGSRGTYERTEDANSLDFKAMLKDLAEHKGTLTRDGRFYWTFKSGSTVGRTIPK